MVEVDDNDVAVTQALYEYNIMVYAAKILHEDNKIKSTADFLVTEKYKALQEAIKARDISLKVPMAAEPIEG